MKKLLASLAIVLASCSTLQSLQNSPAVQAAETAGFGIGMEVATGSPAFGFVAPIAVNGLTALANGSNPTAVTGIVEQDAPLIVSTVKAAIPNSTGKTVATAIATAYTNAMNGTTTGTPLPATPTAANAVIAAIAAGLTNAATTASTLPSQARWKHELSSGQITASDYRSFIRGQSDLEQMKLPVRNAAFLSLSRADQRDATACFQDEAKTNFSDHAQWLRQLQLNKITRAEYLDMLKDEKVIADNAALRP